MAYYIVQFTRGGAKLKTGLTRQASELLALGLWGVPAAAQLKLQAKPGDGVVVAVGSPDRVFVGDAVVARGYHRFSDEEAARFPNTLSYDHGISLTQICLWPPPLPVIAAWSKTAAADSNPAALWIGALTELGSADAATITGIGRKYNAAQPEYDGSPNYDANTALSDQERHEILALLARGLPSARIAQRLGISTMRVAAIKAHVTMGTYDANPGTGADRGVQTTGPDRSRRSRSGRGSSRPAGGAAAASRKIVVMDSPHAAASIGIDVAESRKGLDLVALDHERSIVLAENRLTVEEVVEIVTRLRPTVVCIDSPSGWAISGKSRLAERQLASLGIHAYSTGPDPGDHPF